MTSKFRLSPDFEPIVEAMKDLPFPRERTLDQLRHGTDYAIFGTPEPVQDIREFVIEVPNANIGARLYRPQQEPSALLVYFHGGGWVMGDLVSHDHTLRALANRTKFAIVAVDYRLAPEFPFPAAFEDALAAVNWAWQEREALAGKDIDLIVGGDSAGGNLAAAVALATRSSGPELAGQLLVYPVLDGNCTGTSYATRGDCPILTAEDMRWYWDQYAPGSSVRSDIRLSPAACEDLAGSPPAIVAVAGLDPLRDEALDYAVQLARSDVKVRLLHYPDLPHGFFSFHSLCPSASKAFDEIAKQLRDLVTVTPG